ncbi:sterol desaturase family protein, partial [Flavihumibacter sediminis]|nr:sterol desaturase family protein [Flavihumibacter sediminis]
RDIKPNNFLDAYFGEIIALAKDVYHAPGIKNKFLYLVMPPGWSHTGEHKTAHVMKQQLQENK